MERINDYQAQLTERIEGQHADILNAIRTTGQFAAETEAALKQALDGFTKDFLAGK